MMLASVSLVVCTDFMMVVNIIEPYTFSICIFMTHSLSYSSLFLTDKTLQLVTEVVMSGVVHQVIPFNDMLLVTTNNSLILYKWSVESCELQKVCNNKDFICALFVRTLGDFILVSAVYGERCV